jgi:hypothetical protein
MNAKILEQIENMAAAFFSMLDLSEIIDARDVKLILYNMRKGNKVCRNDRRAADELI